MRIYTISHTEVSKHLDANFPDNPLLGPQPRADFIIANTPLVDTIIYRYFRSQLAVTRTPRSDTVNDGTIGLINAYDRYNDASVFFGTFAFPHIYGEISNALSRRPTSGIRIPEWLYPLRKHAKPYAASVYQKRMNCRKWTIAAARTTIRDLRRTPS
jgi:DNA-directed RNA polymerase specialized sigma subunit